MTAIDKAMLSVAILTMGREYVLPSWRSSLLAMKNSKFIAAKVSLFVGFDIAGEKKGVHDTEKHYSLLVVQRILAQHGNQHKCEKVYVKGVFV